MAAPGYMAIVFCCSVGRETEHRSVLQIVVDVIVVVVANDIRCTQPSVAENMDIRGVAEHLYPPTHTRCEAPTATNTK